MYLCRDAVEQMVDAEEGALSGWARVRYAFHVTICPHCRTCRRQLRDTVHVLGTLRATPADPVPPEVEDAALAAFRERNSKA